MPENHKGNGWNEYQRLVMASLNDLKEGQKDQGEEMGRMRTDIATLKVKAGIWGGLAGLVPFGLFIAARLLGG